MREVALHLLDLGRNAIESGATEIEIIVEEERVADWLRFIVRDNGCGMDAETLRQATDPFFTTRTTRRQGLGLALLKETCERCGGRLEIKSAPGKGTIVEGSMRWSHIDRPPLGKIGALLQALICAERPLRLRYCHVVDGKKFFLDTAEIEEEMGRLGLNSPAVLRWLKEEVEKQLRKLRTQKE